MIHNPRNLPTKASSVAYALAWLCVTTRPGFAETANQSINYYFVDAYVLSLDAKQSLASYEDRGHVSGTPGSTIGNSTPATEISIELNTEGERFLADVTMTNRKKQDEKKKQRVDLTNLRPTTIDIESGEDGRRYQLNLIPTIKTVRTAPKSFQTVTDEMYEIQFHSSSVTLNDKRKIGDMLASNSDCFNLEICGLASIEFSLRHLKGAQPWGTLSDGQIRIANPDGTFITISNVTNGHDNRIIPGGPYTVWVRWNESHATVEEYRAALKAQREILAKNTPASVSADTKATVLARIDQELAREPGPWIIDCGAHSLQKSEFSRDE